MRFDGRLGFVGLCVVGLVLGQVCFTLIPLVHCRGNSFLFGVSFVGVIDSLE